MKVVDGIYKPAYKGQGNSEWGTREMGMSPNERRKSSSIRTTIRIEATRPYPANIISICLKNTHAIRHDISACDGMWWLNDSVVWQKADILLFFSFVNAGWRPNESSSKQIATVMVATWHGLEAYGGSIKSDASRRTYVALTFLMFSLFFWKGLFEHRISSNVMVHQQYPTGGDPSQNVRIFSLWYHTTLSNLQLVCQIELTWEVPDLVIKHG